MKGIILAGGSGTRLYPLTLGVSKQLMAVYDKPMVYYSLSTLMLAGIREILVITTVNDRKNFENLLGDGSQWGIHLSYATQAYPAGLADAFLVGENFIGKDNVCLILGDNIFYGEGLGRILHQIAESPKGATIFCYHVNDPKRYGVVEFNELGQVQSIQEKPAVPKSNYAVTGLYFYDNNVINYAKSIKPSHRGELEITDINNCYLKDKHLNAKLLGRGTAWLDIGTHQSLLDASNFIHTIESRQGLKVNCPEEIAWVKGFITTEQLRQLAESTLKSGYGEYLLKLCENITKKNVHIEHLDLV